MMRDIKLIKLTIYIFNPYVHDTFMQSSGLM